MPLTQQRDIYETVTFRFLFIYTYIYLYICICIYERSISHLRHT